VPWRRRNSTPDGPRYKALGNSMAVNVMGWIGGRIESVEDSMQVLSTLRPSRTDLTVTIGACLHVHDGAD
jgi:hypothetical protein